MGSPWLRAPALRLVPPGFLDGDSWLYTTYNAASPLTTPTYDGSGQAVHPSIVTVPGGLGGYTHWMAMTPYTNGNSGVENPSIIASNDGLTWVVPDGLTNPLDEATGGAFNADTELVLVSGTLYCFWRYWDGTSTVFYRTSTDGVNWGPKTLCLVEDAGVQLLSPMIWHDGTTWHMWYVYGSSGLHYRTASAPDGPWSARTQCNVMYTHGGPWHQAVFHDGLMWRGIFNNGGAPGGMNITLASSRNGLLWHTSTPVINARPDEWDAKPYRATGRIEGGVLRMWYSAESAAGAWRIGYTEIPANLFPNPA